MTAWAVQFESPTASRFDGTPRGASSGRQHRAAYAGDRAVGDDQFVDPVPVMESRPAPGRRLQRRVDERFDDAGAGAPGDVEARYRVAVPVGAQVAALGPADGRQEA